MSTKIYQCELEKMKSLAGLHTQKDVEQFVLEQEWSQIRQDAEEQEAMFEVMSENEPLSLEDIQEGNYSGYEIYRHNIRSQMID